MIQHGYKHRRIGCGLDFRVSECRIFLEFPGGKHADHLCLAVDDILFDKLGGVVTEVAGLAPECREVISIFFDQHRSEEHTSETPVTNAHLVCRLLLEKKIFTSMHL